MGKRSGMWVESNFGDVGALLRGLVVEAVTEDPAAFGLDAVPHEVIFTGDLAEPTD